MTQELIEALTKLDLNPDDIEIVKVHKLDLNPDDIEIFGCRKCTYLVHSLVNFPFNGLYLNKYKCRYFLIFKTFR